MIWNYNGREDIVKKAHHHLEENVNEQQSQLKLAIFNIVKH